VEPEVLFDVPVKGDPCNCARAGMVLHGSDNAFLKLTHASRWETRQAEWAKEALSGRTPTTAAPS
jgi:arabinan endo-1,5-alpha-L-arabinosidase